MRRALLLTALLVAGLSACGAAPSSSSKFQGQQADVAKVVDDLASAGRSRNAKKICDDILARQLVAELKAAGGDCESEMKRAIDDATDYDLQVKSVKVTGNNATAQVRQGDAGQVATFTFVKEGGTWRASALGGS